MSKFQNSLLTALSQMKLDALFAKLTLVELKQRQVLYEVGDKIEYVYFMETGVASVLTTMENGAGVEVGMIGFEGIVGAAFMLGNNISDQHIVIQIPGKAYQIKASICKTLFDEQEGFRKTILKFVDSYLSLSSQTAACNRLHTVEQRCARWLLMSCDRSRLDSLPLTQEYLAYMMGVRRSGVTEAAGQLQRDKLITYNPGHITITDREGLEKTACECYRLDWVRFERLIAQKKK